MRKSLFGSFIRVALGVHGFQFKSGVLLARYAILLAVFGLLPGMSNVSQAQPTLSVSPAITSNSYPGVITLTITGLTNGEKVTIQRYLDANANSSIDPGELMLEAFNITDGGAMTIGGVTNTSVPFDSNPVSGAITTTLQFAPPYILENMVGQHIYRVVSPTGRFAPVTAMLTVTNAAIAQSLSGTVYSNGTAPLPYAVVVALQQPNSDYAGGTVADAAGHYTLNLNPGTYGMIATAPNYYFDQGLAPMVTLTNGMNVTNDLSVTNGTVTISGNVFDAASSNGLGGVMVQLQSGNLFAIASTDTNGNYSAGVSPNFWKIKATKERLGRRAYVVSQNTLQVNATSGNVTNAGIALYKGNALFYGRITDNASVPFANVQFDAGDGTNNQFSAKGYSDVNGNYAVAVLATNTDWNCNANGGHSLVLNSYVLNNFDNTNLFVGQALHEDYVALPVTATITGQVHDNLGNPVVGASLYAYTFFGGKSYQSVNFQTDSSGNYSLGVLSGSWQVDFSYGGESGLDTFGLFDYYAPHNVSIPPTNTVLNLTVYQNGTPAISQPQRMSSTQFGFSIIGTVGVNYTVQVSTNLASTNWVNLLSLQLTNSPFPIVDTHATNSLRFYRVQKN